MTATDKDQIVCVVDDDEAVRDSTQMLLGIHGFKVRSYARARDFLAEFTAADTGCLILDIHMPEMTGVELLTLLRARGVATPAIIVSGQVDPAVGEILTRSGALAILSKPVNQDELMGYVEQALTSA
ncbi:MAG TPA: response regulator [Rhizomicrobium sp.]|nr:response regulator [Rhizomicrobium sp.]